MRVMVLVKVTGDSEASIPPTPELLQAMGQCNQALAQAGILLQGAGLKPTSHGNRVAFDGP